MEENNILNNLPPFYVGQKVVHIRTNIIYRVKRCVLYKCGEWVVDIGLFSNYLAHHTCTNGCCIGEISSSVFYKSSALAPIQQQSFPLIELAKVIEKEKQFVSSN